MNRTRTTPRKIQQALIFVRSAIAEGRYTQGSALPTIRDLSVLAGVSYVTMWKAISILHQEGVVNAVPGRLVMVAGDRTEATAAAPRAPGQGWQRLRDQIERDILRGVYASGSRLPLLKQLQSRYSASHPTLAKALRELQRMGILTGEGRGFSVRRLSTSDAAKTICFLVDQAYLDRYFAGNPTGHDYIPAMVLEAARRGFGVVVEGCTYKTGQIAPLRPETAFPAKDDVLGYIYVMNAPAASEQLVRTFTRRGKPVSILEEFGRWPYTELLGSSPLYKLFPVGSRATPGSAVGRFLLGFGHCRVAYLSADHIARWSLERLEGLRDAFARAGYSEGVRSYTLDVDIAWLEEAKLNTEQRPAASPPGEAISIEEDYRSRLLEVAYRSSESRRRHLLALFKRALSDEGITAWVAANDDVAILASDFLRRAGVAVPGCISLVSFDDGVPALAHRISSYNFNIPAIVSAAISHITEYSLYVKQKGPQCVEIDGVMVDRRSAGAPPGR